MMQLAAAAVPSAVSNNNNIFRAGVAVGSALTISCAVLHRRPKKNDAALIAIRLLNNMLNYSAKTRPEFLFLMGNVHGILSAAFHLIEISEGSLSPLLGQMLLASMFVELALLKTLIPKK